MAQGDGRSGDPPYESKNKQNKMLLVKHSFLISQYVWEGNFFQKDYELYTK